MQYLPFSPVQLGFRHCFCPLPVCAEHTEEHRKGEGNGRKKLHAQSGEQFPDVPIIASGGNTNETIRETIRAGANAITYTPPGTCELFKTTMSKYGEM